MGPQRRRWPALALACIVLALGAAALLRRHITPSEGFQCLRPRYEPDLWNDGGAVQESSNCMSYAMQEENTSGRKMQPGQLAGLQPLQESQYSCGAFVERLRKDRPYLLDTDAATPCPCNSYKIGLLLDNHGPDKDYHFIRQDAGGMYSHKPGSSPVTNLDASGNVISDPLLADWDFRTANDEYNYDQVCGFFCTPTKHVVPRQSVLAPSVDLDQGRPQAANV